MKKLGIYVDSIEHSQLFLKLHYEAAKIKNDLSLTIFYNNHGKLIETPIYEIMPASNLWKTRFPVIATDIMAAKFLASALVVRDKYFYIWAQDWLMRPIENYQDNIAVYCNPKLKLLTRNELMYNVVKNTWKEPVGILNDFDHQRLYELAA